MALAAEARKRKEKALELRKAHFHIGFNDGIITKNILFEKIRTDKIYSILTF